MNFAAWGRLFDDETHLSLRQRALKAVASALNPFFQIQSLHDFNQKFAPEWLPRSIVLEDATAAPTVSLMYASVEGFVKLPIVGRYLVPAVRSQD
jgi:lysyl-tRNA synthetase, class II